MSARNQHRRPAFAGMTDFSTALWPRLIASHPPQRPMMMNARRLLVGLLLSLPALLEAQADPRAGDFPLKIGGRSGPLDAITDVAGVEVGHTTLISGDGPLVVGQGPGAHRRDRRPSARQGDAQTRCSAPGSR